MRKWIGQDIFEELVIANANDRLDRMVKEQMPLLGRFQRFVPEAELFFQVYHNETEHTNEIERVNVGFHRNGILFFVDQRSYPKPLFDISCDCSMFRYTDRYSANEAKSGLTRPNHIGVFTKRKIDDWIAYQTAYYRNLERIDAENGQKITTFRRQLEALPDVIWDKDRNGGQIRRNGLTYSFSIHETGYSEKVTLETEYLTLNKFLLLSDNKYISEGA